jgi:bifunctional non-homologous end joining protein LigD
MALQEYQRKRNFNRTSEPPPGKTRANSEKFSYLIQKHDATRLHYDLRIELDGVLLSWAVTKGPSLNPTDKRLAVRTEDHPLAYGTFEGTIPEGEYGGGTVMLWDTGSWEPLGDPHAGLKKGHLSFTLHGDRLHGQWHLVRMRDEGKRENWLLIKEADEYARNSASGKFLESAASSVTTGRSMDEIASGATRKQDKKIRTASDKNIGALVKRYPNVQLATLVDAPPEGAKWLHEIKFDGYRLLGFVDEGEARLRTRNGHDWTKKFPSLCDAIEKLKIKSAVLDMEAVVLNTQGKSDFQALQAALGIGGDPRGIVAYVFDLLHLNGEDLTKTPLTSRKKKLREVLKDSNTKSTLRYSDHMAGRGAEMFAKACEAGLEGIVSKIGDSHYLSGRQKSWLKIKCIQRQEFIIVGYSNSRTGGRALGALYLGYRKDGKLTYAGKVGTGFSVKSARDLVARFASLTVKKPVLSRAGTAAIPAEEWSSIHWLKPALLCEVAFTEWTEEGRIRHPSFQGLREDKDTDEVVKEAPVEERKPAGALVLSGVTITHPDRVVSDVGQVTKGQLAEYYASAMAGILPHIVGRPLSLLRCPSGFDGECFFQRNPGKLAGQHVKPFHFTHKGKKYVYLYIEDERGLLELIQIGTVEFHPWGATVDAIDYPDQMIFDLDPDTGVDFEAVKLAALDIRKRLKQRGLQSAVKCTGGKGLHVTVPLAEKDNWTAVKAFAKSLAEEMAEAAPDAYVATMSKAKRKGKIFIDYLRNDYTATAIADYSVRARPGAPIALPLEWKDLKTLKSASQFTVTDLLKQSKLKIPKSPPPQALPKE